MKRPRNDVTAIKAKLKTRRAGHVITKIPLSRDDVSALKIILDLESYPLILSYEWNVRRNREWLLRASSMDVRNGPFNDLNAIKASLKIWRAGHVITEIPMKYTDE